MSTNNSGGSNGNGFTGGNFITYTFTSGSGGWVTWPPAVAAAPEKKISKDGCNCKKCKEFYPYAEPNQDDGTLICYQCRIGW